MAGGDSGKRLSLGDESRISNRYKTTFPQPLLLHSAATVLVRNCATNLPPNPSDSIKIAPD